MSARSVGPGFFPLDDELALLPGSLTPRLQESLVRLSTWLPSFATAAAELAFHTGVTLTRTTAMRVSEAAGVAAVAVQTTEVATILRDYPDPSPGPETVVFHVDGAMVPLRHGVWGEVKTLAVGAVEPPVQEKGEMVVHTRDLSYFSRISESTSFAEAATAELHRRGVATAERVGVVVDGAEWIQGFIDLHAPEAVRILDFPHAAEYVTAIGQTVGPEGSLLSAEALAQHLHDLKHNGPEQVLTSLRRLVAEQAEPGELGKLLAYLDKREAQMQYPRFREQGWPIGSGSGESANKLLVEAWGCPTGQGAGMHWAVQNVNPMLALRNAVCNDRWVEVWEQIEAEQRRQVCVRREQRRRARRSEPPARGDGCAQRCGGVSAVTTARPLLPPGRKHAGDGRPAADHPWRRAWSRRRQAEEARMA
ncbi:MAG: hypothetical protein NVS2B7_08620 [Herpetosiphon sp.]